MLFCLAHQRRLECETEPDYNKLPPSRIGRFASQLRAALVRASLSGGWRGGGVTASFCSGDFLSSPGQRVG